MGVLDQVMQMQNQGMQEQDIMNSLRQQGVSPREISDALSQSQIKNAITDLGDNEMQPSITQEAPMQQTQEIPEDDYTPQPQNYSQAYAPQQTQEYYPQENYASYSAGTGTDTIIDIAEQVFMEKIRTLQKSIQSLLEFQTISQEKIQNLSERLSKIESTIDKLQLTILDKVGSYGDNLSSIKKEMSMMQDSFGKMANKKINTPKAPRRKTSKKKAKKKKK